MNTPEDGDVFPYELIDLTQVAVLFGREEDKTLPLAAHRALPLPNPSSDPVAIVIDGLGSSSVGLAVADIISWLQIDAGLRVAVFSYQGITTHFYQPEDTVKTSMNTLVEYLDEYVRYYSSASALILVGYSFGGLIISEWLYRQRDHIAEFSALRGSCLIASPIRVRSTRVFYRREHKQTETARGYISALLEGYTAIPEHVPVIAPMAVFRCDDDKLLDASAYTFEDLHLDDRPQERVIAGRHQTIVVQDELRQHLLEAALAMCDV